MNLNQRGFGVVGYLVTLPFLLSVLAAIAATALALKASTHLQQSCRLSVLTSQRTVAEKLRALIQLNPEAAALREQAAVARESFDAAIDSGNPAAIALAEANVARVTTLKTLLHAKQLALIAPAKALSITAPLKARSAVLEGLTQEVRIIGGGGATSSGVRTSIRRGQFHVVATPEGDSTPDYQPADTFTAQQTVNVEVHVPLAPLLPDWLRPLVPNEDLEVTSHCQATIEKREDQWAETLNAVR